MTNSINRTSGSTPPQPRDVSRIFTKGQIWYWEDPIYFSKREGYTIPEKVSGPRYSRYVIIAQNSDTASHLGIVVIPCSSKRREGEHDVEVPINHLMVDDITYAKCQSIMNVDPKTLIRYICTIPYEAMAVINGELIKMFTGLSDIVTDEQFVAGGINMINNSIGKYGKNHRAVEAPEIEESIEPKKDPEVPGGDPTPAQPEPKQSKIRWTDDNMRLFIKDHDMLSSEEMRKRYNLSEATITKYYYKFKGKLGDPCKIISSETSGDPVIEIVGEDQKFTKTSTIDSVVNGCSIISNCIGNYLRFRHISKMCSIASMPDDEFYRNVSAVVYFSLLQSMRISTTKTGNFGPEIDRLSKEELISWKFFNGVGMLDKVGDWNITVNTCKNRGIPVKIPSKFFEILEMKLKRCNLVNNQNAKNICDLVKNRFV